MRRKTYSHDAILGSIALYGLVIGTGGVTISIIEGNKIGIIVSIIVVLGAMSIFIWHDEKERKMTKPKNDVITCNVTPAIRVPQETLDETLVNKKEFRSIFFPLDDEENGELFVEPYDEITERTITAFLDYCAAPSLKDPNDTIVTISYVKREPNQPTFYKGTTLRRWCIDHGNIIPTGLHVGEWDGDPYRYYSPDGGMRNRTFIDFSFDDNSAHICHHIDPLFGFGYAYDYSLDAMGKLVLSNKHKEWIS